jgi:cysteine desulfurase/selenocysteine lyase
VRTGHHCAEPLIEHLQVPGTVRASLGLYNTQQDVDAFIAALKKAIMMLE